YQYDKDVNVTSVKDAYGTETYEYNKNNYVTKMKDTEENVTDIAYDGLYAVSETDQSGKSSSASVYDKYENHIQSSKDISASTNI
ncbi:hypothetical protein, partial [Bacillus spizizenii]|uniref:hypothetical protein n=1 Tax=Bacillus spizizenii TaxID=96241 RepID=UPI00283D6BAF